MGEGSGRGSGRVRLFVGNRGSGDSDRVGSTFRRVGSDRIQEKCPVDISVVSRAVTLKIIVEQAKIAISSSSITSESAMLINDV